MTLATTLENFGEKRITPGDRIGQGARGQTKLTVAVEDATVVVLATMLDVELRLGEAELEELDDGP